MILLVDVSLTAIQAGFKKRDLFDPVVAVVRCKAHGCLIVVASVALTIPTPRRC